MILAEKIMELRKRSGLSQEEFGAEIGVSRQAVSKWEMAQTTPDLNKIMAMSRFFGVSTDFLLDDGYDLSSLADDKKNDIQAQKTNVTVGETDMHKVRMAELQEIQNYLAVKKNAARSFVTAIGLFFASPFAGILITVTDEKYFVVGLLVQMIMLVIAAVTLIIALWNLSKYKELWQDGVELAYGVRGFVSGRKKAFEHTCLIGIIVGAICLLSSVIPMMIVSGFTDTDNLAVAIGGCIMLVIFAAGCSCITYVLTINHGYKRVLGME